MIAFHQWHNTIADNPNRLIWLIFFSRLSNKFSAQFQWNLNKATGCLCAKTWLELGSFLVRVALFANRKNIQ